jgi:alpha/beta superfamily hydrolase
VRSGVTAIKDNNKSDPSADVLAPKTNLQSMAMSATYKTGEIKTLMLPGPVGQLEALLNVGAADATHAALVCHPHPLFGGTMHNKVVYNAMKSLTKFGFHALRFNFRGTGLSGGVHDEGRGERDDVRAALDFLDNEFHLPIIFCGFSFGAATGLKATCGDSRVVGQISLGTPVSVEGRLYEYQFLSDCKTPKLFVSGSQDQYSPEEALHVAFANAAEPKKLVIVPGADHFFVGKLNLMQAAVEEWVAEKIAANQIRP